MITMLLGPPGAGKSYEAVVFHVLPALKKGRKVITNLPLNLDAFAELDEEFSDLIELRKPIKENLRPFSAVEDFGSDWKHPKDGYGPLFVVDECHMVFPFKGTPVAVEEWFALHRHENVDVVLITQTYGKVSKNIVGLCETFIECKKNVNLLGAGKAGRDTYRREVRDAARKGTRLSLEMRTRKAKYYPLYSSYTKGGRGVEVGPTDVKPLWRNWVFYATGLSFGVVAYMLLVNGNPFALERKTAKAAPPPSAAAMVIGDAPQPADRNPAAVAPAEPKDFRAAFGALRVSGRIGSVVMFRDGPRSLSSDDLLSRGVRVWLKEPCLATLAYRGEVVDVRCQ